MSEYTNFPQAEANAAFTHDVENMPTELENYNMYTNDALLQKAIKRGGAEWAEEDLQKLGQLCGSAEVIEWGNESNKVKPRLETHNRYGHRIDEVIFHPAYHNLMSTSKGHGVAGDPWANPKKGAHVKRAGSYYMIGQVEAGHGCPITMTFAAVPTLMKDPKIAAEWIPKVLNTSYDPRNVIHTEKESVTIGMAMTEKQGGSDVRQNSTRAYPIAERGSGQGYELVGHKFFVSAPMCDAFLMLAQAEGGISCFLVPRWRPDGTKNPLQVIRLKDKMGNASNASSETELRGAFGWLIGDEGRGIANILEKVAMTRYDCILGSSAAMRQHMTQIVHHTSQRKAFGDYLDKKPLMQNVLADLELEAQASALIGFRVAESLDNLQAGDQDEGSLMRMLTPVGKYWICKRQPGHAYEAMETIGGSAVMENSIMPRFYREAPINTIWEGSGNVQCLDVLRAMQKDPNSLDAFFKEVALAKGSDKNFDAYFAKLQNEFTNLENLEYRARSVVEKMAIAVQGSLMLRYADSAAADAFIAGRMGENSGNTYGMLPQGLDLASIIDHARVEF